MENRNKLNLPLLREFMAEYVWPYIKYYWWALVFYPALVLEGFISPFFLGKTLALIGPNISWPSTVHWIIYWILATAIIMVGKVLFFIRWDTFFTEFYRNLRKQISIVLFNFDIKKFLDQKPGEIYTKLEKMETGSERVLSDFMYVYSSSILFILVSAVYIFVSSWQLGLLFIVGEIIFLLFWAFRNKYLIRGQAELNNIVSKINGDLQDKTANLLIVKNQAKEKWEIDRFFKLNSNWLVKQLSLDKKWSASRGVIDFLQMMMVIMCIFFGVFLLINGQIETSALISSVWLFQRGSNIVGMMVQNWRNMVKSSVEIADGMEVMKQEILVKDVPGAQPLKIKRGDIEIKNINFDYGGKPAIRNLSLSIPAGKTIALVGHSGAGKSTMATLLMRYYDLKSGEILIDGQNIADVTQESLRKNVAFVMQDNSLFHESLGFNIEYGCQGGKSDHQKIVEASKQAQIHDFIKGLEEQYETKVGQRGLRLSGGERQRISIARAILKNAPIMILDEATSALDSINEKKVQKALNNLMKGKTSIVIAHRLSTVKKADLIVVLKKGKIVEQGTHAELVTQRGEYSKLVKEQVNGMLAA